METESSGEAPSLTSALHRLVARAIGQAGGWLPFDRFMALVLYAPGLGYYANGSRPFGTMPHGVKGGGSDFVTAPELSPLFGQTLAIQVAQALAATGTRAVWEFGAGSGALAEHLLDALAAQGTVVDRYTIVELSGVLRERQQTRLAGHAGKVVWADELPPALSGVVVGNEVLDAMPVQLLARLGGAWHERGVALHEGHLAWADRPTALRPPVEVPGQHDYLTEIHPQAEAFMRTLADRLLAGEAAAAPGEGRGSAAFFIDYGFPEAEYWHPQRHMGTVMCHRGHLADGDPLADVGLKDITAHVNFTGVALAGQDAGLEVLGYTSQARFLLNCGLLSKMEHSSIAERGQAQKLITEHEMGELFKVIGFATPLAAVSLADALGFSAGDRSHTL